ncbi:uncharacterized protein LOC125567925 [Nematostella vectensis]|uniref:uncharacterized protein LOC125567925 n=1 Tax=Nematostella vectensis TaxID=45351 RepID=UPI002076EEF1|nr:uncharacterized protein LOC125567925 [Nematostella vectensis]
MACSQPELTTANAAGLVNVTAEDKSDSVTNDEEYSIEKDESGVINMELEEDEPIDEEEQFAKTMEAMACFVFFQGRSMEEIRQTEVELGPLWAIVVAFRD